MPCRFNRSTATASRRRHPGTRAARRTDLGQHPPTWTPTATADRPPRRPPLVHRHQRRPPLPHQRRPTRPRPGPTRALHPRPGQPGRPRQHPRPPIHRRRLPPHGPTHTAAAPEPARRHRTSRPTRPRRPRRTTYRAHDFGSCRKLNRPGRCRDAMVVATILLLGCSPNRPLPRRPDRPWNERRVNPEPARRCTAPSCRCAVRPGGRRGRRRGARSGFDAAGPVYPVGVRRGHSVSGVSSFSKELFAFIESNWRSFPSTGPVRSPRPARCDGLSGGEGMAPGHVRSSPRRVCVDHWLKSAKRDALFGRGHHPPHVL